jgi:hypothetical protein
MKPWPLNSRLLSVLCQELGSERKSLLLDTEVHLLLLCVFELRDEVQPFLTLQDHEYSHNYLLIMSG